VIAERIARVGEARARDRTKPGRVERLHEIHADREAVVDDQDRAHRTRSLRCAVSSSAGPISWSGRIRSAAPHAAASRGIPYTTLVASSCAIVKPPRLPDREQAGGTVAPQCRSVDTRPTARGIRARPTRTACRSTAGNGDEADPTSAGPCHGRPRGGDPRGPPGPDREGPRTDSRSCATRTGLEVCVPSHSANEFANAASMWSTTSSVTGSVWVIEPITATRAPGPPVDAPERDHVRLRVRVGGSRAVVSPRLSRVRAAGRIDPRADVRDHLDLRDHANRRDEPGLPLRVVGVAWLVQDVDRAGRERVVGREQLAAIERRRHDQDRRRYVRHDLLGPRRARSCREARRSSVITSGRSRRVSSTARRPSEASPTTSRSGARAIHLDQALAHGQRIIDHQDADHVRTRRRIMSSSLV